MEASLQSLQTLQGLPAGSLVPVLLAACWATLYVTWRQRQPPEQAVEHLVIGSGYGGPNGTSGSMRCLNNLSQIGWYCHPIERPSAGELPQPGWSPLRAMMAHLLKDFASALRRKFA